MRINYVLDSFFPTEKAYGVTTINTINALTDLGHEVFLFCHKPKGRLIENPANAQVKYYKCSYINKLLRKFSLRGYGKLSIVAWNLSKHLSYFENRRQFNMKSCDLIWTREMPMPRYTVYDFDGIEVVEVHNKPTNRTRNILRKLDQKRVVLCPISKTLEDNLHKSFPGYRILWSPMGIKHHNFKENELTFDIEQHYSATPKSISIGYFGKLAPNGISKGFEDLLDLGVELYGKSLTFKLLFIGPQTSELELLKSELEARGINQSNVLIQTHLPHDESLKLMKKCDFLILPANRDLNYSGFPLKALEYVMSLRVVIAAKTKANQEVFLESFQPFWYEKNNLIDVASLISQPIDVGYLENYLREGYLYAKNFSWSHRTQKILELVSEIDS